MRGPEDARRGPRAEGVAPCQAPPPTSGACLRRHLLVAATRTHLRSNRKLRAFGRFVGVEAHLPHAATTTMLPHVCFLFYLRLLSSLPREIGRALCPQRGRAVERADATVAEDEEEYSDAKKVPVSHGFDDAEHSGEEADEDAFKPKIVMKFRAAEEVVAPTREEMKGMLTLAWETAMCYLHD